MKISSCQSRSTRDGTAHLVLVLVWSFISQGQMELMERETQRELYRTPSEDLFVEIQKLSPEEILRRWVHDQVKNTGRQRVSRMLQRT
jgi:hypothetical protein